MCVDASSCTLCVFVSGRLAIQSIVGTDSQFVEERSLEKSYSATIRFSICNAGILETKEVVFILL